MRPIGEATWKCFVSLLGMVYLIPYISAVSEMERKEMNCFETDGKWIQHQNGAQNSSVFETAGMNYCDSGKLTSYPGMDGWEWMPNGCPWKRFDYPHFCK